MRIQCIRFYANEELVSGDAVSGDREKVLVTEIRSFTCTYTHHEVKR
jgi:hypothetical protein